MASRYAAFWFPPYPRFLVWRTTVVRTAVALAPHRRACSKVSSWLASSEMMISATLRRTSGGMRSRVAASVDAALYATTTIPILAAESRSVIVSLSSPRSLSWLFRFGPHRRGQQRFAQDPDGRRLRSVGQIHHPHPGLGLLGHGQPIAAP